MQIFALKSDKEKLADKVESLSAQLETTTKEKLELQDKVAKLQEQLGERAKEEIKETQKDIVDGMEGVHVNAIIFDENT